MGELDLLKIITWYVQSNLNEFEALLLRRMGKKTYVH